MPFVNWTANDVLNDNLNLTAGTEALNGGATGLSIGALHPPQMQSREVRNAAPNVMRVTWSTPWPLSSCDATKFTPKVGGSARAVSGCTVVNNTTTDVTFGGAAVTQGQTLTLDVAQTAVKSAMVGCATALCQSFGTAEYVNYLWNESFAVTAAAVTNNVATGCAPTVTNCTVPDSATDDHVRVTIDTCASSPSSLPRASPALPSASKTPARKCVAALPASAVPINSTVTPPPLRPGRPCRGAMAAGSPRRPRPRNSTIVTGRKTR